MFSLILLFIILLGCSAFFSSSETSLFSLSGVQLHKFRDSNARGALKLTSSLKEPRKMLVTILLGNELVNVGISVVGAAIISGLLGRYLSAEGQTVAAVLIITPIVLVFGDLVPKSAAFRFASQLAPVIIWPLYLFHKLIRPVRNFLTMIADYVISFFGGRPEKTEPMIMEEEFRRLIDLGRKEGVIVEEERELIHNVFDFTDKVVEDIMTPAERVFSLPIEMPYKELIGEIKSVQFSRVPFYENDKNNVIGILHVRDLFSFHRKNITGENLNIRTILHEPLFVDTRTPLETLLEEFKRTQLHMAIAQGDAGEFRGLVTMDDVLEELFGEME